MTRNNRVSAFALALAVMAVTATPVNAQVPAANPGAVWGKSKTARTLCYVYQWATGQSTTSAYNACG